MTVYTQPHNNLYSKAHFKATGSATLTDAPTLLTCQVGTFVETVLDTANPTPTQWDTARFHGLGEGDSMVLVVSMGHGAITYEGYRITRLPDYRMNRVVFDNHAKEFVMVSNGKCVLNHSSTDAFNATHDNGTCRYAPSEAVALRPILTDRTVKGTYTVRLAYTYRAVNPCHLRPVTTEIEVRTKQEFEYVFSRNPPNPNSFGRV